MTRPSHAWFVLRDYAEAAPVTVTVLPEVWELVLSRAPLRLFRVVVETPTRPEGSERVVCEGVFLGDPAGPAMFEPLYCEQAQRYIESHPGISMNVEFSGTDGRFQ